MILAGLILGALAVGVLSAFWDKIHSFLKKAAQYVKTKVIGLYQGSKVLAKRLRGRVQEITKNYSRVEEHWKVTTVINQETFEMRELPDSVSSRLALSEEADITDELELELQNAQ